MRKVKTDIPRPAPTDPPTLVADSAKIREKLGWKPLHDDLAYIVKTAWDWEKKR